jgi:hypothetical protein
LMRAHEKAPAGHAPAGALPDSPIESPPHDHGSQSCKLASLAASRGMPRIR